MAGDELSFAQRMNVAARAHGGGLMKLVWPRASPHALALTNRVYMQLHRRQFECGGNTGSGARKRAYVTSVANGREDHFALHPPRTPLVIYQTQTCQHGHLHCHQSGSREECGDCVQLHWYTMIKHSG